MAPEKHVFAGTYVTAGTAEARVTATGMSTRFGRIAELAQQTRRDRSPLERELDRVTRLVALLAVSIGVLFFLVAGLVGMGLSDRFLFAIGVMVALVPEGLLLRRNARRDDRDLYRQDGDADRERHDCAARLDVRPRADR